MEEVKISSPGTASGGVNKFWIFAAIMLLLIIAGVYYEQDSGESIKTLPARKIDIKDISARADNVPSSVWGSGKDKGEKTVTIDLHATQVVAEISPGVTYEYWTYNNQVPGPFMRAREGDMVEISLTHEHAHAGARHVEADLPHSFSVNYLALEAYANGDDGHILTAEEMEHAAAGHGEHSIDLHAVLGPGGGAEFTRAGPNETKTFKFKALRPGLYIYHCASSHVPSHIANGMYGLILVEPKGGLPPVDHEFYVVQGEIYTTGKLGEKGHQELDRDKLLGERPEYFVFNGRPGALIGSGALRAKTGEKIRIFFGVSGQLASNFHIIGEIFDFLYPEGDIVSASHKNVQTTLVPGGGAAMVEFTAEVPGRYLLVDHALTRAIDRGALGELIIEGPDRADIFGKIK